LTPDTLYLVHVPILIFLCACVNNPWNIWPGTLVNFAIILLICGLTMAFAFGFYLVFEANTDIVRNFITGPLLRETSPVASSRP
jgi:peptidoglycan/LPS O-acetylase OafA/YrhL